VRVRAGVRKAHVDVVVPRADLARPGRRRAIRARLVAEAQKLGTVIGIEGFVADPPDGPFRDAAYVGDTDLDENAIVRAIAWIDPFSARRH
jgi:hypothetical protein